MCEALIRVRDKAAPHHPLRAHKSSRGDVIVVMPDGWTWSERERTNPDWRIVRFPGLSLTALDDLTQPVFAKDGRLLYRRARALDLDSIVALARTFALGTVRELTPEEARIVLAARKNRSQLLIEIG